MRRKSIQAVWLVVVAAGAWLGAATVRADSQEFDFKDPKGVNAMTFTLDSVLEPIVGTASGVSGKLKFDAAKPESLSGKLVVESASLQTSHPKMKEVLHSADWLDVKKYPEISFAFKEIKQAKKTGEGTYEMQATGDFTCHGITKPMTVTVKATYLPDRAGDRMPKAKGDLLVLRTEFTIKRSDFGIKPDAPAVSVADEIQIRAGIVGVCAK